MKSVERFESASEVGRFRIFYFIIHGGLVLDIRILEAQIVEQIAGDLLFLLLPPIIAPALGVPVLAAILRLLASASFMLLILLIKVYRISFISRLRSAYFIHFWGRVRVVTLII